MLPSVPPPKHSPAPAPDGANKSKPLDDFYEFKLEHKPPDDAVEPKPPTEPPEDVVEPKPPTKPPDYSFSFESEPPTFTLQRPSRLSSTPTERPTETIYSAITNNFNDALILSPYLVHAFHPYPSQSLNGPMQPEPDIKPPPTHSVEPNPPPMPYDGSHVSKPSTKPAGDVVPKPDDSHVSKALIKPGGVVEPNPPSWPPYDSHVSKEPTKLRDGAVEPKPPPWPPDDSHVSKLPTKIPDDVVEPKPPSWPPDDDAFEANPTTKPLDDPRASILLKKPPDKAYVPFGIPTIHFMTGYPSS